AFEEQAAKYLGVKHAIGVNSGTDALVISLAAAGVGKGNEVLTTPFTFFATAEAISQVGAEPVFVDIDPVTFNLDVTQAAAKITPRTKAIIPVHLFGQAAAMTPLVELARENKLLIIEDVAQAFGGEYQGRKLGSIGHLGAFSFFPTKNLGGLGDGGLIATNDDNFAERALMLRAHGSKIKYCNEMLGYNSRLDELQAAILGIKLRYLDSWNEGRRQAAAYYNQLLGQVENVVVPKEAPHVRHVYHQYTIRVQKGLRDQVSQRLNQVGIGTMIYYPVPLHRLPVYQHLGCHLPAAEQAAGEVLSLPIWPLISRETQLAVGQEVIRQLGALGTR
ncbi:MAG TPA: DegT/DnrJ/EryC1/StrS family aminotransferase, partial [Bacillota bacterium]|nr:DegT/DnrJ/EryC1/StrS family aminotransferase [Bacillota bacterium]